MIFHNIYMVSTVSTIFFDVSYIVNHSFPPSIRLGYPAPGAKPSHRTSTASEIEVREVSLRRCRAFRCGGNGKVSGPSIMLVAGSICMIMHIFLYIYIIIYYIYIIICIYNIYCIYNMLNHDFCVFFSAVSIDMYTYVY